MMSTMALVRYGAAYAVCGALGVAVGWGLAMLDNGDRHPRVAVGVPGSTQLVTAQRPAVPFTMRGRVSGLMPGKRVSLNVRVSNPNPWPIRVLTLTVSTTDASTRCRAHRNIRVGGYDSRRRHATGHVVAGYGTAVVSLPISLVNSPHRNQDACKGAVFRLHYAGTATRVGRP
jgi:hypothetical protein